MKRALLIVAIIIDLAALAALAGLSPAASAQGTVPPNIGQPWSATPTATLAGPALVCAGGRCWVQWPSSVYLPKVSK